MRTSKKKKRHYTLPTSAVMSNVIRRVMNRAANKDISEDDIFKKLSHYTGLSLNYFKVRRRDVLKISDKIATELGLERDSIYNHFGIIESIIHQCVFDWPALPDEVEDRKEIAYIIAYDLVRFFEEADSLEMKYELISLDDIYDELVLDERVEDVDPELLAYGLVEVWDYLLDQSLIT